MGRTNQILRMIYRLYRKKHIKEDLPCPDEETLVCFSEGTLTKSESEKIQQHLISCHRCAEVVSLFCRSSQEAGRVPEFLIKQVKRLIKQDVAGGIFKVVIALKEKALEILETTGDVIMGNEIIPMPVLRGRKIDDFPDELRLIKVFRDIEITIFFQRKDNKRVRINLNLIDKSSLLPLDNLRVTLSKDGCEFASHAVVAGNVVFENVSCGRWVIRIARKDENLGDVNLEII